jgi:hypothetical protein
MSNMTLKVGEVFTWTSDNGKCTVMFMVSSMLAAIKRGELRHQHILTSIDETFAKKELPRRDLDMRYVNALSAKRLAEPVLGAYWHDGTVILIDGNHRYMALYMAGMPAIEYYLVAYEDWQPYAFIVGNASET